MSTINNIVVERFRLLPKPIQEAITNSDWSEKVRLICKKNQLAFDAGTVVENSTLMVMVGVLSADELLEEILEEGVSEETAKNVIREIEAQIFLPIKNELVETFNKFENTIDEESEEDNSLDVLAGNTPVEEKSPEEEREQILKEIEDMDSSTNQTKEPQVETNAVVEQKVDVPEIKAEEKPSEEIVEKPNSLEQKLTEVVSTQPQVVKIDPYRETIE